MLTQAPGSDIGMRRDSSRPVEEYTFRTHDDVALFYRSWPAAGNGAPRGAIVLFHRGHEHSGRMAHLVDEIDLPDFAFFAWDARGHGRSPGQRGHSPSIGTSVRDVETFIRHITTTHGIAPEDIAIVAQSVGAVLVALYLLLVANLVAWPAAYWATQRWLQDFAYRAEPAFWVFAAGGALALLLALLTVGGQAVKTALKNPVEALRYE